MKRRGGWIDGVGTGYGPLNVHDGESTTDALTRWRDSHRREAAKRTAAADACQRALDALAGTNTEPPTLFEVAP